jgi:PAS domain S-box-containing protein
MPNYSSSSSSDMEDSLSLAALEQLGEGVIVADRQGKLIFVNSAAAKIHGMKKLSIEPDEYTDAYQLLTPEGEPFPPETLPLALAVFKGEVVEDAHWKIRRPDGSVVDAVGTAKPVFGKDGEQVASVLTLSDRTDAFSTRRALEEALKTKETLLYEVNHRVKNNLAIVSALLKLQTKKLDDEEAQAALADISARVGVLSDIHGRLYQTGGHTEIEVVSFLGEQVRANTGALAVDHDVAVKVRAHGSAIVTVDKVVPIALAMNELVLNSIKHAFAQTAHPVIELDLEVDQGRLNIVYKDNGCGLPQGEHNGGRKGIGQALVMNLSAQAQAKVEIGSDKPGEGYRAAISIPLPAPGEPL